MPSVPLTNDELQVLVLRAQGGSNEAFERIYEHFFNQVYRYSAFRLPRELAEDVTAEIFIKAWQKIHRYKVRHGVPFGAWLFRIARHTVIDAYRSYRAVEEIPETIEDPDLLNRADHALHQKDLLRTVRAALDRLPRRYREVLLLCYIGDLPHREVARVLRMTEGGVRILKFRALQKLEQTLPPELHPENVLTQKSAPVRNRRASLAFSPVDYYVE